MRMFRLPRQYPHHTWCKNKNKVTNNLNLKTMIKKLSEIKSQDLTKAMNTNSLVGGGAMKTEDIKTFGLIEKFDVQTSLVAKTRRDSTSGEFVPILDENGSEIMQNISFPVVTGSVNGIAGSTIALSPFLRGVGCVGKLNDTQLNQILEVFGENEVPVVYELINNRKYLKAVNGKPVGKPTTKGKNNK